MKLDNYECDGQVTLNEYLSEQKPPEPIKYGDRGCRVCVWYNHDKNVPGCCWNDEYWLKGGFERQIYPDCKFMPDSCKGIPCCDNCEHSNCFIYEEKPGMKHKDAMYDPVEEPNIYCDHRDGSLNRHTAYKDLEQANFGVGHWHRQHEWDICDRWEHEKP